MACLGVAATLLTGALTVTAINGSPYEVFKNAVFNALTYENVTMRAEFVASVNGVEEARESIQIIFGDHATKEYSDWGFTFSTDGLTVSNSGILSPCGSQWYSARTIRTNSSPRLSNRFTGITANDLNSAQFRFFELFIDLMVGDLKNNLTMSSSNGVRTVNGTITHSQLPEIIKVGIDLMLEQSRSWYRGNYGSPDDFRHPLDVPIRSFNLNHVNGTADIDAAGNLLFVNVDVKFTVVDVFGRSNYVELEVEMNFTDIGTSDPQSPIPNVVEIFTPEFLYENFGRRYNVVYFLLNEDGTVDLDSITTDWPGRTGTRIPLGDIEVYIGDLDIYVSTTGA
jgi:hypothetical protein